MADPIIDLNIMRQRILNGEEPTTEEMTDIITALRNSSSRISSGGEQTKPSAIPKNLNDLF